MQALEKPGPSASVVAAAAVAILASVLGVLCVLLVLGALFLRVDSSHSAFPEMFRPFIYAIYFFFLLAAIFCLVVSINLLRLRNWARIAILVISGCGLFFGITGIGVILMTVIVAPTPTPPGGRVLLALMLSFVYGIPTALALWWLILFTRPSISSQFQAAERFRGRSLYPA